MTNEDDLTIMKNKITTRLAKSVAHSLAREVLAENAFFTHEHDNKAGEGAGFF